MGATLHWHAHPLRTILCPRNSDVVLSGGEEGVVAIWYLNNHQPSFIPRICPSITHMAVTNDGVRLVVCGNGNTLSLVEVSQKAVRAMITGLGLGAVPASGSLSRVARAGLAFDQHAQQLLLPLPGASGQLQVYDPENDRQVGVVGEGRQETAKTHRTDQRGTWRVDHMRLSLSYEWLFTVERWATSSGLQTLWLKMYRRDEKGSWDLFSEVGLQGITLLLLLSSS